ncbi:hypothetical protein BD309DRAFT_957006 [Dichomitus squalens]|uniref:DUF7704 domain-containing protein n=3 Tax=Dichomitus squalens TaxID=114155 RepID=A0A4V2K4M6_9APHY|nr:uncharacterized protein DICSQDRAFT_147270 [Dichomitus squalens LYAD-421 SS1]EJF61191.1 hypothetical protein DICSQDRAFT_147270 [Dichomitus squalens LYAD-421 SS1]TBU32823.1 hypothetical protein BD311DRAFT_749795 [Dichomitus squalens]TBU45043.1 hypothetical protein BD309DRAFT_957006 [Dichomitus squalens]
MSPAYDDRPTTALPWIYWVLFGLYEPLLAIMGFAGAMADPKTIHDAQAPWPSGSAPPGPLAKATQVTMIQLAHTVGLLGLINVFVLGAARKYLFAHPVLQEKIVGALFTPLLFADVVHIIITWWALGDNRWHFWEWSSLLWLTFLTGFSLLIPRVAWHMGVGRYVDRRDGQAHRKA